MRTFHDFITSAESPKNLKLLRRAVVTHNSQNTFTRKIPPPEFLLLLPDLVTLPTLRGGNVFVEDAGDLGVHPLSPCRGPGMITMNNLITYCRFEVSRGMGSLLIQSAGVATKYFFGNRTPHAEITREFRIQQMEISY
jgi:hypothetical protein